MKSLLILFLTLSAFLSVAVAGESPSLTQTKTAVEITSVISRSNAVQVSAVVRGATTASQLVLFLKFSNQPGFIVAANEFGEPVLPVTEDPLQALSTSQPRQSTSRWTAAFHARQEWGKLQEIHAIVCTVRERQDWPRSRDYKGFSYLPFARVQDINEALEILRDFGWTPTGLTRVEP